MDWVSDGFTDNLPLWQVIAGSDGLGAGRYFTNLVSPAALEADRNDISKRPFAKPESTARNGLGSGSVDNRE
jgi:hypothetical protein